MALNPDIWGGKEPTDRPKPSIAEDPPGRFTTAKNGSTTAPVAFSTALSGNPLPIAWGRVKLPVQLIERYSAGQLNYPVWRISHAYALGDRVQNSGAVYECMVAGTSATGSGPSGRGTAIVDGSVRWYYVPTTGDGMTQRRIWIPLCQFKKGDAMQNKGNAYECITAGKSAPGAGPTSTAADVTDGTCHWKYIQALPMPTFTHYFVGALCEGEIEQAEQIWMDKTCSTYTTATAYPRGIVLKLGLDSGAQAFDGVSGERYDSSGYQHTALLTTNATSQFYTDSVKEIPNMAVEIKAVMLGSTDDDPNPADIVTDLLTHTRRGCGWPTDYLHSSIAAYTNDSYRTYCDATGLRFSMVVDSQVTALDLLKTALDATNSDAVWSQGQLKIVPLGDQTISSPVYGSTAFVPSNTAQFNLTTDDFIGEGDPVTITCKADTECNNAWPIEYTDRAERYTRKAIEDPDMADIDVRGILRAPTISLPVIFRSGAPVTMLSRILAQRSHRCRNEYRFTLGWRYCLLEPTDIVTLTDSHLGLSLTPVRIIEMEETEKGFTFTAEDYPAGVAASASFTPASGDGFKPDEFSTASKTVRYRDGRMTTSTFGVTSVQTLTNPVASYESDYINFDKVIHDESGLLSGGTIKALYPGMYSINLRLTFEPYDAKVYTAIVYIYVNALTIAQQQVTFTSGNPAFTVDARYVELAAGDVVAGYIMYWSDPSGSGITIQPSDTQNTLTMTLL